MKQNATSMPFFSAEQIANAIAAAPDKLAENDESSFIDWDNAIVSHSLDELRIKLKDRQENSQNQQGIKEQIVIDFSSEVLSAFRASGKGWQTRMDDALKDWLKTHTLQT